ncbi:MAG: hypothetical protein JWM07_853, partial [Candidatus Saccharibacteria bacterium]|nr:hypothetical protein [Candidatus Saccharibacteria bacterium]
MQPEPLTPPNAEQPIQPEPQPVAQQQESVPQQPAPMQQPEFVPEQPAPSQQSTEDPGKIFSIIGLICAFIFFQLPGLILSIIGYKKSKKSGFPTTLAMVGIILNALFMFATIGILTAIALIAYNGVQERATDTSRQMNAQSIAKKAEVHAMESMTIPTIEDLRAHSGSTALTDEEKATLKDTAEPANDEIGYVTCKDDTDTV